jgi:hypothetical protein
MSSCKRRTSQLRHSAINCVHGSTAFHMEWQLKQHTLHRGLLYFNTVRTGIFFLDINHKSLIQSKVTFFLVNHALLPIFCCSFIYCVIKCVKSTRVLKGKFASSVFQSCKEKTPPKTRKLVSVPQCVKILQ